MKKIFLFTTVMFISFLSTPIFAQLEDPGSDPDAASPAPIDDFVWVLLILGLVYVFTIYKTFADGKNIEL